MDVLCAGHLISSWPPLGVMGLEVLSERECTRDAEWKLLHLTLLNPTLKAEVGDLSVSLRHPQVHPSQETHSLLVITDMHCDWWEPPGFQQASKQSLKVC